MSNIFSIQQFAKKHSAAARAVLVVILALLILIMTSGQAHAGESGQSSEQAHTEQAPEIFTPEIERNLMSLGRKLLKTASKAAEEANLKMIRGKVYSMKSGTKVSAKDIKAAGGIKSYFQTYGIKKGDRVYKRINGKSYRNNSVVALSDLKYLRVLYYDFDDRVRSGEIIVNKKIAKDTRAVFVELYRKKYQIRKMRLVDDYWQKSGSPTDADTASMNDDNTSAFNYRTIAGTSTISKHGYGLAIDVNPFENPWCPGGRLYPNQSASAAYANRSIRKAHMIFADSEVTKTFKAHGFRWLGETATRDYQHFEK